MEISFNILKYFQKKIERYKGKREYEKIIERETPFRDLCIGDYKHLDKDIDKQVAEWEKAGVDRTKFDYLDNVIRGGADIRLQAARVVSARFQAEDLQRLEFVLENKKNMGDKDRLHYTADFLTKQAIKRKEKYNNSNKSR